MRTDLNHTFQLIYAKSELSHCWFIHLSEAVLLHQTRENSESILFGHIEQKDAHKKSTSLTITHFTIKYGIGFHDIEESFLSGTSLLFEEVMFGVSAGNVSLNDFLTGRGLSQEFIVLFADGTVVSVAQQLPNHSS